MTTEPARKKDKSLTPEAFAGFLEWLSPDHERAASQYLDIRGKLVKSFIRRGCAHSEELSDRTLDRVAVIVSNEPGKYPNPIALCCGVARRVWLEYLREIAPGSLESEDIATPIFDDDGFSDCELDCLGSCLEELSPQDRDLITQYHRLRGREKIETRKRLAREIGGLNKLRITTYRIRVRLHHCISGCVRRSAPNRHSEVR
jgi:hypothetical protein